MNQRKYKIELTEAQCRVIMAALEEYFRINLNQWGDLSDRLALMNTDDLSRDNPNHAMIFELYIQRRDIIRKILMAVGSIVWSFGNVEQNDDSKIAQDIWAVIRHHLYINGDEVNPWCAAAVPVFQIGPETLPSMESVDVSDWHIPIVEALENVQRYHWGNVGMKNGGSTQDLYFEAYVKWLDIQKIIDMYSAKGEQNGNQD